jgi:LacI family transcriptional regulator
LHQVTIRDVAARAAVSTATVSAVLNNSSYVSEPLSKRVKDAISILGYRPNAVARSLRNRRTATIAVLISTIISPFFPAVVDEVDNVLAGVGLSLLLGNTKANQEQESALIALMREKRVDGLLIAMSSPANLPLLSEIVAEGTPVVAFHTPFASGHLDCVTWDDSEAAKMATRHLLRGGKQRIAVVGSPSLGHKLRLEGYQHALREAKIEPDPQLQLIEEAVDQTRSADIAQKSLREVLNKPKPPDAAFVISSSYALFGVLRATRAAGLRIPEDMAVVAYDDYPWTSDSTPAITVVARDRSLLGATAARLLLNRLEDRTPRPPETIVLPTELRIRASTINSPQHP